jgi:HD superfamily phosphohydrolase
MDRLPTVRCPIHGFIELNEFEVEVVNHQVFQRLRRIHQLAMAYLAFPGAVHTRFDHSLGALHCADRLARAIGLNPRSDGYRNIRLAALLHDIGHGPFSHVSEYALQECAPQAGETESLHERITLAIIRQLLEGAVLNPHQAGSIHDLLNRKALGRTAEKDIVSGPLDADKLDYLLRDSYFCGVRYGVYDLDRLVETVVRIEDREAKESYLGVREEDISAVDQYVLARHNLGQVYYHKVRRIADAMLVRSIVLAVGEANERVCSVYRPEEIDGAFLNTYLESDDETLVRWILACEDKPSAQLMSRLRERRLVKEVFREPLHRCGDPLFRERNRLREGRKELEQSIANICSKDEPWLVFVDVQEGKALRKGAWEEGPETIHVLGSSGERRLYDVVSPVFRFGVHRGVDYLNVYAPLRETEPERKRRERNALRAKISELIGLSDDTGAPASCPHCGQSLPEREGQTCVVCGQPAPGVSGEETDDA